MASLAWSAAVRQPATGDDYLIVSSMSTLPTAAKPMTAAATARPTSSPLILRAALAAAGAGRGAAAGAAAGAGRGAPVEVGGRVAAGAEAVPGAAGAATFNAGADVGGRGGGGAAAPAEGGAATAGAAADVPPAAGIVGSLMVGAAVGFGGRLMRTVSFLGCTLAASPVLGGTAPGGPLGVLSAILFESRAKLGLVPEGVKLLIRTAIAVDMAGESASVGRDAESEKAGFSSVTAQGKMQSSHWKTAVHHQTDQDL